MKILLLNQTFYPDVVSTAQHLSELAVALAERGHQVTVITSRRAYDHPEKMFPASETWRGIQIHRIFSTRFGKAAKWRRAADFASFILAACLRLLWLPRHDVVLALTSPPLISFIGAWRAKLWRAHFGYWVMDLNPDEAIAAGWLRADSFSGRLLEQMSRFSFGRASVIFALDRFMRDRILAKQIAADKIKVLPPWSHDDAVAFDPVGRENFRRQHGLTGKWVVMYSGNHSPVHPLDTVMQAAEQLAADDSIAFCFVGGGSEFKRIQQWRNDRALKNILCLPYQPLDQLSASLSAADAQIVALGDAMRGIVHPCKIYNLLNIAAPILYLGPDPSHITDVLALPGLNVPFASVRNGDVAGFIAGIRSLSQSASATRRPLVTAPFHKNVILPQFVQAIESLATHCPKSSK